MIMHPAHFRILQVPEVRIWRPFYGIWGVIGGTGFEHPKLFYCYCCIKLMLMIRLKVCEVCDIYALGYELRVE
jgi:hypothetical protein